MHLYHLDILFYHIFFNGARLFGNSMKIFFIFAFQKLKFRQSGKACIVPIFNRTAKRKVLNSLELLGFRISVSGFEFANFSAMMRLRSNDRRFAE